MTTLYASTMTTPIGPLTVLAADDIVRAGGFTDRVWELAHRLDPDLRSAPIQTVDDLGEISAALRAYFDGEIHALDTLPVQQPGGALQRKVWDALRAIQPGAHASYRMLARDLGDAALARAVGMACASNLISPIVPCHRVTRTDGSLAGYSWGVEKKRWLLDHEAKHAGVPSRMVQATM